MRDADGGAAFLPSVSASPDPPPHAVRVSAPATNVASAAYFRLITGLPPARRHKHAMGSASGPASGAAACG
ncbi:hypothetical protein GCM10022416_20140 [Actinomadura keratinilytica]|uniref:Uncharacterized protein n=1 Tax=Actinomadura keratinilytica TaxID=547461 RepID=A0ABP7YI20_9ACTN